MRGAVPGAEGLLRKMVPGSCARALSLSRVLPGAECVVIASKAADSKAACAWQSAHTHTRTHTRTHAHARTRTHACMCQNMHARAHTHDIMHVQL